MFNNTPQKRINIVKFMLFGQDRKVNDMYHRSFNMNTDTRTIRTIEEMMGNGESLTSLNVVQKCSNLISLTPHTTGMVTVNNGWNEKRLSFVLIVEVLTESSKIKDIYFLNGYTDYYDPILRKQFDNISMLDPTLVFHINTITLITEMLKDDGTPVFSFKDKITLLKKVGQGMDFDRMMTNDYIIRPEDVFKDVYMGNVEHGTTYDNEVKESDRSMTNTVGYISSIMNSIIEGSRTMGPGSEQRFNMSEKIHNIANAATTTRMMECPFLTKLYQFTGESKPSWFNIEQLFSISSHLNSVTEMYNVKDSKNVNNILSSDYLSNSLQPTEDNLVALEFYQIVSSLLFDNMLTRASIVLSNHPVHTTTPLAYCLDSDSMFHPVFNTPIAIENIDIYLKRIVLPKLTRGGNTYVNITADINILGFSSIAIEVNDFDPAIYRFNSSMDNTFSPYITDLNNKRIIADETSTLIDTLI